MTENKETPQDQQEPGTPEQQAPEPEAPPVGAEAEPELGAAPPVADAKTVEEGKAFAILSYALSIIGLPFFLVPLIMRNNAFALYHAKQCLILWLAGIAAGVISGVLSLVCIGVVIGLLSMILFIVLCILGIINTSKGLMTPLPVIGKWGEDWFKGLTVAK